MQRCPRELLASLVLIALSIAAFEGVASNGFVSFDDNIYVTENQRVLAGLTPAGIAYAWTTFDTGNWHPLTWMSLELDATLFGNRPAGYHITNLVLHLCNVGLLFLVLRRMTGAVWRSAIVAAFFAVHPLHVESVAWVAERKDVLSTLFLLLALDAYERYAARPSPARYMAVLVAMALGLLAKPMLVTLPCLMLLLDYWPLRRWGARAHAAGRPPGAGEAPLQARYAARPASWLLVEKIPLFALSIAASIIALRAQGASEAFTSLTDLSVPVRLGNAVRAYAWYLEKTFWPVELAVYYPHPLEIRSWPLIVGGAACIIAVSGFVIWNGGLRRHLPVGWFWFLGTLVPVIGLVQVGSQAYADRYSYVPQIGLLIMLVWEAAWLLDRCRAPRPAGMVVSIALLGACIVLTRAQTARWKDSESLWKHTLAVDPDNWIAHYKLGRAALLAGKWDTAENHFAASLQRKPGYAESQNSMGWILQHRGDFKGAERHYRETLRLAPQNLMALGNLAALLKSEGRTAEAIPVYARLAELRPDNAAIHHDFAVALGLDGKLNEAVDQFAAALKIEPSSPIIHHNLALALTHLNRLDEAKAHLLRALQTSPRNAKMHYDLGIVLEKQGDVPGAIGQMESVMVLTPGDTGAQESLQRLRRAR